MAKTIRIKTETAKYYLNLEVYFARLCEKIGIDPDRYLEEQQTIVRAIDPSKRGLYREELFEGWQNAVGKREYRPSQKTGTRVHGRNQPARRSKNDSGNAPNF